MNLRKTLDQLNELSDDEAIFARRPWTLESEAMVGRLDDNHCVPTKIAHDGFDYFLEVSVAQEVLGVFGDDPATDEEARDLLLFYAENDAYPGWVYSRTQRNSR